VINTHSSTDAWLVAVACATLPRMPAVVRTRHVSTPVNNSTTTRWLYTRATAHLVVTGEALKAQLVRDNGYDPARITSVRTGIDLARFRPLDGDAARARLSVDARPAVEPGQPELHPRGAKALFGVNQHLERGELDVRHDRGDCGGRQHADRRFPGSARSHMP